MDWFYIFVFCICTWSLRKQIIHKPHDLRCGEERHLSTEIFPVISNRKAVCATSKAFPKTWKGSDGLVLKDHFYMHSAKYLVPVNDLFVPHYEALQIGGITFPFHSLIHIHRIRFLSVNVKKHFILRVMPSLSQPYYLECGCRQYNCLGHWFFSNHLKLQMVLKTQRPSPKQTWWTNFVCKLKSTNILSKCYVPCLLHFKKGRESHVTQVDTA